MRPRTDRNDRFASMVEKISNKGNLMENNRMANDKLIEASFKKSTSWLWFVGGKHHHNRVANQGTSNDSE
jgi:hypothetical protein